MTTHDNTKAKLKAFDAFAPVADALEAIPNLDVPVARDFAKRVTGLGEKFATDSRDAVEKATATIENTAVSSIRELEAASVTGAVQTALYQDAAALLAGLLRNLSSPGLRRTPFKFSRTTCCVDGQCCRRSREGGGGPCRPSRVETGRIRQLKAPTAGPLKKAKPAGPGQRARILEGPASAGPYWLLSAEGFRHLSPARPTLAGGADHERQS